MKRFSVDLTSAVIVALLLTALVAAKIPVDAREAHERADGVLYPALVSAMNEFALDHGAASEHGHLDKINAKDVEHFRKVRDAFKTWLEAMKQAGY